MRVARTSVVFSFMAWLLVACGLGFARIPHEPRSSHIEMTLDKLNEGTKVDYRMGWFDLDGSGDQEAVVLMMGSNWCGTGGCTLVVLKHDAGSWTVVSRVPTSRLPVVALEGRTNGWRDLAVITQGGGDIARKQIVLRFQKGGYVKDLESKVTGDRETIIPGP